MNEEPIELQINKGTNDLLYELTIWKNGAFMSEKMTNLMNHELKLDVSN